MTDTGNKNIHFEIKSQLAKLLATENITVQHKNGAQTASFDVKSRILTLPVWQNISEDLYDMLVVHEVGHALDTPTEGWKDAIDNIANKYHNNNPSNNAKQAIKDFLNVIEDARIDKRQKRRYPGSKRNYVVGYKELNDRDFFGINKQEIASLGFIDRINLYYKTSGIHIQFSNEEKPFLHRISNAETFEEVIQLTDEIYAYAKQKQEEQQKSKTAHNDIEENEEGEDAAEDYTFDNTDEDEGDLDPNSDDSNDTDEESDEDPYDAESDGEGDEIDDDEDDDVTQTSSGADGKKENDVPESITEQAARRSLSNIVRNDNVNYIYCHLPKLNLDLVVDDYPKVMAEISKEIRDDRFGNDRFYNVYSQDSRPGAFHAWRKKENETISFMVKEFEMKKAADIHSRVSIAKTGVIDTNKLFSYKYNEDIFRKLAVLPQGKNHGFVMILDWSGSMHDNIEKTVKQLISLTLFCRRVQIPFEVYLFRNTDYQENMEIHAKGGMYPLEEGVVQLNNFKLRNILSSRMNTATLNKAYENLWHMSFNRVTCDVMDSTPLNQAIIALDEIILNFQRKNKLQIVNTIILTDGSSDPCGYVYRKPENIPAPTEEMTKKEDVYILRDQKTGITYVGGRHGMRSYDATTTLLKILKERTGTNLIGFYLHNGSCKNLSHIADYNWLSSPEVIKQWKDDKFLTLTNQGYDKYYVLNVSRKRSELETINELTVDSNMTKSKIAKEFIRYSEKKTINRVLLSKFIDQVSTTQRKAA